ncbi:MAG: hypothetical protein ACO1N0_08430 [Fluviicola sp.]
MNFADNNILLLLISLVFIYAVLSILVSILTEAWNHRSKARGIFLKDSIYKMLKDPLNKDYGYLFYNHVTISGLKSAPDRLPHYISSRMFAEVLIDIIAQQAIHNRKVEVILDETGNKRYQMDLTEIPSDIIKRFQLGLKTMNTSPFTDLMQSFLDKSKNESLPEETDYSKLKAHIEQWFNDYMDRVSGWYKTKQQRKFLIIGFIVAISLNVDSLHLLKVLSLDDNLKNRLVESAEETVDNLKKDSTMRSDLSFLIKSTSIVKSKNDANYTAFDSIDAAKIQRMIHKLDSSSRIRNGIAKKEIRQLDSAVNMIAELNVPIGWSSTVAPASWWCANKQAKELSFAIAHDSKSPGLIDYMAHRNSWSWGNFFKYLLGIIISGVSLSFGAPFWFDILTKFVNVRRSGKIPEGDKSSKS